MKTEMKPFTFILAAFYGLVISCVSCQHALGEFQTNDGKIVGGTETTIQSAPYQVYILFKQSGTNKYFECGGSIATQYCILTAAHCLTGMESATIRVGSTYRSSGGSTYTSRMLIQHPKYNTTTSDYDVAVIRVFRRINIDGVNSSLVYTPNYSCAVPAGTNLTITGWGDTTEGGTDSETLRITTISAISDEKCKETYPNLTPRMTCAGIPEGGRDTCQGDSGGPLVITGTRFQSGIVSYGLGCARPQTPGVYTNVCNTSIQKWINRMGCS